MLLDLLRYLTNPANLGPLLLAVFMLGMSIFVHELGHFLVARWRGVHVARFSIGFGPAIRFGRFRLAWHGRDGVEYQLSWFPLGGYVLLPQLADLGAIEGKSDTDVAQLPPITYTSKMLVFVAGATFNVLFAFVLACLIWRIGQPETSLSATTRIGYVAEKLDLPDGTKVPGPAFTGGLRIGDTVTAIDGHSVKDWSDIQNSLILGGGRSDSGEREVIFSVLRDGKPLNLTLHPRLAGEEKTRRVGISPGYELIVHSAAPGSVGEQAGFQPKDEILRFDDTPMLNELSYREYLDATLARAVVAHVRRAGAEVALTIPPSPTAKPGVRLGLSLTTGVRRVHPSPFAQIGDTILLTVRSLWSFINPHSDVGLSKASGPVGILHIFQSAAAAGLDAVLMFTVLLNVNLAVFNLLPVPVLDGGQMLFATIGRLRGRALPVNFIMAAQSVCLVLLLSLMLYVTIFSDLPRLARDAQDDRAAAPAAPAK